MGRVGSKPYHNAGNIADRCQPNIVSRHQSSEWVDRSRAMEQSDHPRRSLGSLDIVVTLCGTPPRACLGRSDRGPVGHCVMKPLLDIPRPIAVLPDNIIHVIGPVLRARSFPSGHTTTAFTVAAVIGLQYSRAWIIAPLTTLALLAGLSRAVIGTHWPLDILAGACGGWLAAVAGIYLARRWEWGLANKAQRYFAVLLVLAATALLSIHDTGYSQARPLQSLIAVVCLFLASLKLVRLWSHG